MFFLLNYGTIERKVLLLISKKRGTTIMPNHLTLINEKINPIFEEIRDLINSSRNKVYHTVNTEMLNLYWNIGKIFYMLSNFDNTVVEIKLVTLFRINKN